MKPSEQRKTVMQYCTAMAAAVATGNQFVVTATETAIQVQLERLIPNKPTLAQVLHEQAKA